MHSVKSFDQSVGSTKPRSTHQDSEPANQKDGSREGSDRLTAPLLIEWLSSHAALLKQSSKLVAADARLAVTSIVQLLTLAILATLLAMSTWIVLMVGLGYTLKFLGLGTAMTIVTILGVHMFALVSLIFAIRSTLQGFRFSTSREFLKPSKLDYK